MMTSLTNEGSPKAKAWSAIALICTKRIVVKHARREAKLIAAEIGQKCQDPFHGTYLLMV